MNRPPAAATDGLEGATQPAGPDMANHQPTPGASGTTTSATGQTSTQSSASNSVSHSPMGSRDPSPTRHARRATSSSGRINGASRSSRNPLDQSPSRQLKSTLGGPASGLRSLSATTTPTLVPVNHQDSSSTSSSIQAPEPQKPAQSSSELRDATKWPASPRVRSPPLQLLRNGSSTPRPTEQDPPLINVQLPSPSSQQPPLPPPPPDSYHYQTASESEAEDLQMASGLRTPARGPLETVQEVSQPNSPARFRQQQDASLLDHVREKFSYADNHSDIDGGRTLRARPALAGHENGGDSTSRRTTSVPPPLLSRQSSAIMLSKQAKARPEGSTQTMTVETETVSSIPQVALTVGPKPDGMNGTLRTKQSTETIKPPKKEKKRSSRKQPVNSGNGEP